MGVPAAVTYSILPVPHASNAVVMPRPVSSKLFLGTVWVLSFSGREQCLYRLSVGHAGPLKNAGPSSAREFRLRRAWRLAPSPRRSASAGRAFTGCWKPTGEGLRPSCKVNVCTSSGSRRRPLTFARAKMERRLAQIDESVAQYLSQLDTAERHDARDFSELPALHSNHAARRAIDLYAARRPRAARAGMEGLR